MNYFTTMQGKEKKTIWILAYVLVYEDCHKKVPITGLFKTIKNYLLIILEARTENSMSHHDHFSFCA